MQMQILNYDEKVIYFKDFCFKKIFLRENNC